MKMSRFKNMPGVAWLVIGVCVTALALPSAAYASGALKFTGVQGTSGNQADVTPGGQLLTAQNNPADSFASLITGVNGNHQPPMTNVTSTGGCTAFGDMDLAASQTALITSIQINVYGPPTSNSTIFVENDGNCGGNAIAQETVSNSTLGVQTITFPTPVPVWGPDGYSAGGSGDYLSVFESSGPAFSAAVIVNGYATE